MSAFGVIMVAAGRSQRFGDKNYKKPFAPLAGRAVWLHSAELFLARDDVKQLVVVIAQEDREDFDRRFGANRAIMGFDLCHGGAERADSVATGLAAIKPEIDLVAVHDAARPCVLDASIDKVFKEADKTGAAILAAPVASTLKRVDHGAIAETVPRDGLWEAQTPQVFRREVLEQAYAAPGRASATDDAQLVERLGQRVTVVGDTHLNLKITTKADMTLAELILKTRPAAKPKGFSHPFSDDDLFR